MKTLIRLALIFFVFSMLQTTIRAQSADSSGHAIVPELLYTTLPNERNDSIKRLKISRLPQQFDWPERLPQLEELIISGDSQSITNLPAGLFQLPSLKTLTIENTAIANIPAQIAELKKLNALHLLHNGDLLISAEITQLPELKTLTIDNATILMRALPGVENLRLVYFREYANEAILPLQLRNFTGVKKLTVEAFVYPEQNCRNLKKLPSVLQNFPDLSYLSLQFLGIDNEFAAELQQLPALRELHFAHIGIAPQTMAGFSQLQTFAFDGFTHHLPREKRPLFYEVLGSLPALEKVVTNYNTVDSAYYHYLPGLHLRLVASRNLKEKIGIVSRFQNLQHLTIVCFNRQLPGNLNQLQTIHSLDLRQTAFSETDSLFAQLQELNRLRELWIPATYLGKSPANPMPLNGNELIIPENLKKITQLKQLYIKQDISFNSLEIKLLKEELEHLEIVILQ